MTFEVAAFCILIATASLLVGFLFGYRAGVGYAGQFERSNARRLVWKVVREHIEDPQIPREEAASIRRACMVVLDRLSD